MYEYQTKICLETYLGAASNRSLLWRNFHNPSVPCPVTGAMASYDKKTITMEGWTTEILLMEEIRRSPPGMVLKPYKSWDMDTISTGELIPNFWLPSTGIQKNSGSTQKWFCHSPSPGLRLHLLWPWGIGPQTWMISQKKHGKGKQKTTFRWRWLEMFPKNKWRTVHFARKLLATIVVI